MLPGYETPIDNILEYHSVRWWFLYRTNNIESMHISGNLNEYVDGAYERQFCGGLWKYVGVIGMDLD